MRVEFESHVKKVEFESHVKNVEFGSRVMKPNYARFDVCARLQGRSDEMVPGARLVR